MEKQIKEQMKEQLHLAFSDLIKVAVETEDHDYIVRLYTEIQDRLANMLFNKEGPTIKRLVTDFDVPFFEQRLRHKAFDANSMASLVGMTFSWLHNLQMPMRDSVTIAAKQRVLTAGTTMAEIVPVYIKEVHACLDTMEQDMKEFYDNRNHPVVQEMLRKAANKL